MPNSQVALEKLEVVIVDVETGEVRRVVKLDDPRELFCREFNRAERPARLRAVPRENGDYPIS